jgi:hypothetical protein
MIYFNRYKAKKKFEHGKYKQVKSTELTQTGTPFEEEDDFDSALDFADDLNG